MWTLPWQHRGFIIQIFKNVSAAGGRWWWWWGGVDIRDGKRSTIYIRVHSASMIITNSRLLYQVMVRIPVFQTLRLRHLITTACPLHQRSPHSQVYSPRHHGNRCTMYSELGSQHECRLRKTQVAFLLPAFFRKKWRIMPAKWFSCSPSLVFTCQSSNSLILTVGNTRSCGAATHAKMYAFIEALTHATQQSGSIPVFKGRDYGKAAPSLWPLIVFQAWCIDA